MFPNIWYPFLNILFIFVMYYFYEYFFKGSITKGQRHPRSLIEGMMRKRQLTFSSGPDYSGSTEDYDPDDYSPTRRRRSPVEPTHDDMGVPAPAPPQPRKRGRPRGKATPKVMDSTVKGSIQQRHVRRDNVDEEAAAQGLIYKRWQPLNPNQQTHISVLDWEDDTIIPDRQEFPSYCIMCPKTKYLKNVRIGRTHYLAWHHRTLLVVKNWKMLSCKCSEVRSHGRDNAARNKHYHCLVNRCFHPFKTGRSLRYTYAASA